MIGYAFSGARSIATFSWLFDIFGDLRACAGAPEEPAPAVNEEMTITALTDCSYLCVVASGIQQRVQLVRHELAARRQVTVDRFSLVAVDSRSVIGVFSLCN